MSRPLQVIACNCGFTGHARSVHCFTCDATLEIECPQCEQKHRLHVQCPEGHAPITRYRDPSIPEENRP